MLIRFIGIHRDCGAKARYSPHPVKLLLPINLFLRPTAVLFILYPPVCNEQDRLSFSGRRSTSRRHHHRLSVAVHWWCTSPGAATPGHIHPCGRASST